MKDLLLSRQALGVAGIVLALVGIKLENQWVIWAAIALMAVSVLHRLLGSIRERRGR